MWVSFKITLMLLVFPTAVESISKIVSAAMDIYWKDFIAGSACNSQVNTVQKFI